MNFKFEIIDFIQYIEIKHKLEKRRGKKFEKNVY